MKKLSRQGGQKTKTILMNSANQKTKRFLHFLPYVLMLAFGTFYLYWFTNYIFFYQEKSSLFLVTYSYLREHLTQPGGFLMYLAEFQTTFYYYRFIGAVLVALEVCGIIFLIDRIGKGLSGKHHYFIPFVIGAALFYLQIDYQYQTFNNLGILIQLALFLWVISISNEKFEWIPVVLFPGVYFLFGSFSLIFLVLLLFFFLLKKSWIKPVVMLIWGMVFFFIGKELLFFQTTKTLVAYPFTVQDIGGQLKLFGITMTAIILLPLLFRVSAGKFSSVALKNIKLVVFTPILIILVLATAVIPRIDKKNSHYFHVEDLFYRQKYEEVIRFNAQFPSSNSLTAFLNNVSMAETGRLSDSFFHFPQNKDGSTLFLKWEIVSEVLKRGGYFYYSVGMINEAQRWAYEYMVMKGNTPEALKMMIKTDLIKGKYEIAEKYISILEKSVFYRKDATAFRKLLFDEEAILNHPELGRKKQLDVKQDFFVLSDLPQENLDLIIEADSSNIPAIEYKLAWLMLQKDMQGITDMLPVMEKAGYARIPKNVEEAIVAYKLLKVGEMPDLKRLKINQQTEQRFRNYYQIFQQNQGNREQAQRALAREYSDTYWYYVFFS
jgi:hypothetical protein